MSVPGLYSSKSNAPQQVTLTPQAQVQEQRALLPPAIALSEQRQAQQQAQVRKRSDSSPLSHSAGTEHCAGAARADETVAQPSAMAPLGPSVSAQALTALSTVAILTHCEPGVCRTRRSSCRARSCSSSSCCSSRCALWSGKLVCQPEVWA